MKNIHFTKSLSTTAKNLERRFDESKNVLDYFDNNAAIRRINARSASGNKSDKLHRRKCDI